MSEDACRIDVWLWRARFFKSRSLAARFVDEGRVRLTRAGREARIEKASQSVKPNDDLVFALSGRLFALRIVVLGERRGPAPEARALYNILDESGAAQKTLRPLWRSGVDNRSLRLEKSRAFDLVPP